jgi:RNA polymerase II subunit A-like phosphatase
VGAGDLNEPEKEVPIDLPIDPMASTDPLLESPAKIQHRPIKAKILTDDDAELSIVQRVLENVHAAFYSGLPDSRDIMMGMRAGVLEGCVIVFSSVIPIGENVEEYAFLIELIRCRHDAWVKARNAGAVCKIEVDKYTTHVVAAKVPLDRNVIYREAHLKRMKPRKHPVSNASA